MLLGLIVDFPYYWWRDPGLDKSFEKRMELILEIITLSDCKTGWFY
jgi:hypothetical protein